MNQHLSRAQAGYLRRSVPLSRNLVHVQPIRCSNTLRMIQALVEGLSGTCAITNHSAGVLTATELSCFVSSTVEKTAAAAGHRQTPQFGRLLHYHNGTPCNGEFLFAAPVVEGEVSEES